MVIPTLLACVLVTPQPPKPNWELATIKSVICSNVVIVAVDKDPDLWVNLLGVGTPETVDPLKDKFLIGAPDPDWLRSWLPRGTRVWMERRGVTASGRPLVFLYRVGDLFCYNSFLVRSGGAFAARQADYPEFDEFAGLERAARERGIGLWRGYQAQRPADSASNLASGVASTLGAGAADARGPAATVHDPGARTDDALESRHSWVEARDHAPSIQVHHAAPARSSATVGAQPTHRKRRSYARQDWSRFDAMMGNMLSQTLYGGMYQTLYGGRYTLGYGAFDPAKTQHVNGYTRSDGTYVHSYWRRPPSPW